MSVSREREMRVYIENHPLSPEIRGNISLNVISRSFLQIDQRWEINWKRPPLIRNWSTNWWKKQDWNAKWLSPGGKRKTERERESICLFAIANNSSWLVRRTKWIERISSNSIVRCASNPTRKWKKSLISSSRPSIAIRMAKSILRNFSVSDQSLNNNNDNDHRLSSRWIRHHFVGNDASEVGICLRCVR